MDVAYGGHTAVAALLLDRGADVHFDGDLALFYAVFWRYLHTATLLLDRGADPNAVHKQLGTPLAVARKEGCHDLAALLLDRGAIEE